MFTHESIYLELTIAKKKWLSFSIYRLPTPENLASLFEELTDLSKGSKFYEKCIIKGDFNIDVKIASS